jgi:hypothetical protein
MLLDMDNMYQPPGGGPQDNWPTQQLGPAGEPPQRPRRSRSLRWSAGIALAALLAGGGALAATELAGSPAPAEAGSAEQAAALNTILSSASSPAAGVASAPASPAATAAGSAPASSVAASPAASAADAAALSPSAPVAAVRAPVAGRCRRAVVRLRATRHPRAARVVARFCRNRLVRLRVLGGMHGQFTFTTKSGTRTLAFARGVVESASAGQVVVKSADGTSWTWNLVSSTVVREQGRKVARTALADGEQVFVGGPVVSGANDARLIVIRPAAGSGAGGSSGSGSSAG